MSDLSPAIRARVLKRDNYRCRSCGNKELEALDPHHFVFRSQSGSDEEDNLITLCRRCHNKIHERVMRVIRIDGEWYFGPRWRRGKFNRIKRHG